MKTTSMSPENEQQHRQFLRNFTAHEPAIRAFVRRLVPARADADDIMQEVSVVLWEKFSEFRKDGDFRAWAYGVARFEVLGWLRDKGRDRLVLDESVVEKIADESEQEDSRLERQRHALETCLEKVAPGQRDLLMRAYQPQVTIQDLAVESGRTVSGLYQWLYRTRKLLLECMQRVTSTRGEWT